MTNNLFQVLYRAPAKYDWGQAEKDILQETVTSFIAEHCGRKSGVVGIKVGFELGLFCVYTDSEFAASVLPRMHNTYERFYDACEMPREKVFSAGPMYYLHYEAPASTAS
jgi:hypothetical protein